jgi:hypothetical protein
MCSEISIAYLLFFAFHCNVCTCRAGLCPLSLTSPLVYGSFLPILLALLTAISLMILVCIHLPLRFCHVHPLRLVVDFLRIAPG